VILFADQFFKLRDNYIIPLLNLKINPKNFEFWDLKNIITTKLISVRRNSNDRFLLTLNKEDFLKAIFVDIENFYTRSIVQFVDLKLSLRFNSKSWLFITNYYLGFFSITTLFRMLWRGFIFIDEKKAHELSNILTVLAGESLKIKPGNYFFYVLKEESNTISIEIVLKSQGIHEHSWNYIETLLLKLLKNSKSDEKVILDKLKDIIIKFHPTFISSLRNQINYHGSVGISEISNKISFSYTDDYQIFIKRLLANSLSDDLLNKMALANLYSHYFFLLVLKLYSELKERRGINHVEIYRKNYLKKCHIELPKMI
jgi:hypothetical protein